MTKKINCLWSKKKQDDAGLYWLPLMQHLIDTMAVMDFLWDEWLGDGQKDLIIRSMTNRQREKAKQVALFLAAVHDIGKATPAFQLMKSYGHSNDVDFELREKIESVFPGISNIELPSREKTHHSIAGEFLLSKYGVNNSLSVIVGAHHGKPIDSSIELDNQNYYKSNYYEKESETDADLVLSGHTHGGQFFPVTYVGEWIGANDRTYGYEERNDTEFIVTSGISDWEILFKTGTKSEYVIIDITRR